MALNDTKFVQDVINIQTEMEGQTDRIAAKLIYAEKLLKLIKEYLKSSTVTITGSSNQGPFTGTGTIT